MIDLKWGSLGKGTVLRINGRLLRMFNQFYLLTLEIDLIVFEKISRMSFKDDFETKMCDEFEILSHFVIQTMNFISVLHCNLISLIFKDVRFNGTFSE